jgi:hypothetical protein
MSHTHQLYTALYSTHTVIRLYQQIHHFPKQHQPIAVSTGNLCHFYLVDTILSLHDVNTKQVYIYNLIYTQNIQSKAQRKQTFITI